MPKPRYDNLTDARRDSFWRGKSAEWRATALLALKGYRILSRCERTPDGEIDLIAVRRNRLAFVEVKQRRSNEAAEAAVTGRQALRIRRAADRWLARHPRYQDRDIHFDLVLITPRAWPRHIEDGL